MLRREGASVFAMLSLGSIGAWSRRHRGKRYPWPLSLVSPWRAECLAIVVAPPYMEVAHRAHAAFEAEVDGVPIRPVAVTQRFPCVLASDHWSFHREGYPAFMLTEAGPLRSRRPTPRDARDGRAGVDFERLASVIPGIAAIVARLADAPP